MLSSAQLQAASSELRKAICQELLQREADIEPFVGPVDAYVLHMQHKEEWGGGYLPIHTCRHVKIISQRRTAMVYYVTVHCCDAYQSLLAFSH